MKKKTARFSSKAKIGAIATIVTIGALGYFGISYGKGKVTKVPAYAALRVIDGDTFETTEKQRIRLSSAEAPELINCGGPEAKKALEDLILNKPLYIKILVTDIYHRFISLVYTEKINVNEEMIKNGYSYYLKDTKEVGDILKQASTIARGKKLGIYSEKCTQTVNKEHPKCNIKGNTRNGKFYFTPSCGRYNDVDIQLYLGDQWFCTEKEAIAEGYKPPEQCK